MTRSVKKHFLELATVGGQLEAWLEHGDGERLRRALRGPRDQPWQAAELSEAICCATVECLRRQPLRAKASSWLEAFLFNAVTVELREPVRAAMGAAEFFETGVVPSRESNSAILRGLFSTGAGRAIAERLVSAADIAAIAVSSKSSSSTGLQQPIESETDFTCLYEAYLAARAPKQRDRHGVYYTPAALADFVVQQASDALRDLGFESGLLDERKWENSKQPKPWVSTRKDSAPTSTEPMLQVLDPAAGDGVFLCSIIRYAHRAWLVGRYGSDSWPMTVERLLRRIFANELMPTAALLGQLNIAWTLIETDYEPEPDTTARFLWSIANTLDSESPRAPNRPTTPSVILGNPPYRSATPMNGEWIERLMRGMARSSEQTAAESVNYYEVDGSKLGERKVWLQDAYVRFLRWAHFHIDSLGWGVIAMVLNHGLLENITFRGVREKLTKGFDRIDIVDLHGNVKGREQCPDGSKDENIFRIATGVSTLTLAKSMDERERIVRRDDVWGERVSKLKQLREWSNRNEPANATVETSPAIVSSSPPSTASTSLTAVPNWRRIDCRPPAYAFREAPADTHPDYLAGPLLSELMPLHSTAPVTARDRVVVDISRERLLDRLEAFADDRIGDDELREQYFQRSRSARYPRGDTRGWNLSSARLQLKELSRRGQLDGPIRRCLYRPFDWRYIFWTEWMIDWPRPVLTRHFDDDNVALIARRQMLPSRPCNYFWATSTIALDGVIRSDNRGSESIFPLWARTESNDRRPNFCDARAATICDRAGLRWEPEAPTADGCDAADPDRAVAPTDLFAYIYGLFHSPRYQEQYADELRCSFPRVLLPQGREMFAALRDQGSKLLALHMPQFNTEPNSDAEFDASDFGETPTTDVAWNGHCLTIPTDCWGFTVGGYAPVQRWLKQQRKEPAANGISTLRQMVARISASLEITRSMRHPDA